jgi:hypothetical protein
MKLLRIAVAAAVGSMLLCGCVASRLDKVVAALGKDPATVHIRVSTIYGTVEFTRTAPTTNSAPHTIAPDGTISVK